MVSAARPSARDPAVRPPIRLPPMVSAARPSARAPAMKAQLQRVAMIVIRKNFGPKSARSVQYNGQPSIPDQHSRQSTRQSHRPPIAPPKAEFRPQPYSNSSSRTGNAKGFGGVSSSPNKPSPWSWNFYRPRSIYGETDAGTAPSGDLVPIMIYISAPTAAIQGRSRGF